ncbi:MAG TPA: hypothetical protein VD883_04155 [Candidatus Omnitrophota bacterium]|nr:hypothetical protein [Candidatus Omnitrophota bacterium]
MTERRIYRRFEPVVEECRQLWGALRKSRWDKPVLVILAVLTALTLRNILVLWEDKGVIVLQGENPLRANFNFLTASNSKFLKDKSLEIASQTLPPGESAFTLTYRFKVYEEGFYKIFIAGTPPGSVSPQIEWDWFSPFGIVLDDNAPMILTKETIEKNYPLQVKWVPYVEGGYTWIRAGEVALQKGTHELTIVIDEKRKKDGWYVYYLDAIVLAPKNWKPVRSLKKDIPAQFFE